MWSSVSKTKSSTSSSSIKGRQMSARLIQARPTPARIAEGRSQNAGQDFPPPAGSHKPNQQQPYLEPCLAEQRERIDPAIGIRVRPALDHPGNGPLIESSPGAAHPDPRESCDCPEGDSSPGSSTPQRQDHPDSLRPLFILFRLSGKPIPGEVRRRDLQEPLRLRCAHPRIPLDPGGVSAWLIGVSK